MLSIKSYLSVAGFFFLLLCGLPAQALVILQYHHVDDNTPAATTTSPAIFKKHLQVIADLKLEVVNLEQVTGHLRNGSPLPDNTVLLTFDDAYSSVYKTAYPLLKKRKWPFAIFVNTDAINENRAGHVTWSQLAEMAKHGASIANHTQSHLHMVRKPEELSASQWQQTLTQEIRGAEKEIEQRLGQSHKVLCYPYGEYDQTSEKLLHKLGFIGLGQHSGAVRHSDITHVPRFPMGGSYGNLDEFETKLKSLPFIGLEVQRLTHKKGKPMADGVLKPDQALPAVSLTLPQGHEVSMTSVNCYISGQGLADKTPGENNSALFAPSKDLSPGRSRFNCTAPSAQKGRYYWLSVTFIKPLSSGSWPYEP